MKAHDMQLFPFCSEIKLAHNFSGSTFAFVPVQCIHLTLTNFSEPGEHAAQSRL